MNARPSLWSQWLDAIVEFGLIWLRGCHVIWKTALALLIIQVWLVPVGWVVAFFSTTHRFWESTPWKLDAYVVSAFLGIFIYIPLTIYVAASSVGLCKYVGEENERADSDADGDSSQDEGKPDLDGWSI